MSRIYILWYIFGNCAEKMKSAKFWIYLMQKGTFRTKLWGQPKERDQTAPALKDHNSQRANWKTQKLEGQTATWENLGFWTKPSRARPALFEGFAEFLFSAILAQFEDESCETQKTKFIRKRSKINAEVKVQQTAQQRERKPEKNPAATQKIPTVAEFRFRVRILQI